MRERLTQLVKQAHADYLYRDDDKVDIYGFIADRLIEAGTILPPVKVGQTVWCIVNGRYKYNILSGIVDEILISKCYRDNVIIDFEDWRGRRGVSFIDFGKTVFLTREVAEAALKAREKE